MFYPTEYNGCFAACPDPIDFPRLHGRRYLQGTRNAYHAEGPLAQGVKRPGMRDALGHISTTLEDMNRRELVLGTKSRSGPAVGHLGGPSSRRAGPTATPSRSGTRRRVSSTLRSPPTGRRTTTSGHILRRDWPKLGKDLEGKIHIYVGEADNYYLNNAVHLVDDFLQTTRKPVLRRPRSPTAAATNTAGNGDPTRPNALSRLRYHQMYAPKIVDRLLKTAPPGGDVTSWRY